MCENCHMWGEARWEGRKENEGLQISSLSLSLCHASSSQVVIFPHSLKKWRTTCSLNCIWVSCHDRMRSWLKGLLGSDWIWEFCELLWSHYTLCHLRLSLKFQTHRVLEQKSRKTTGKKNKPSPCGVVHEERSEWLSKMDHRQERDWWGETRSDASSIQ